jgi:ribosomal protein RSM22 (predicted rRNA methylase)
MSTPVEELNDYLQRFGFGRLHEAARSLSDAYRQGRDTRAPNLDPEVLAAAYLATRFPATSAAATRCAALASERMSLEPHSLLDLGAGCGASALALLHRWPSLDAITCIERMPALAGLGRRLLPEAIWRSASFHDATAFAPHDVVVLGYSLNEAGAGEAELLARAWGAARQMLLIVEPGTHEGFARILRAREFLVGAGGHIVAPCPSAAACPVEDPDWCHFAVRVQRSALHKRLKDGTLGYEDEKFSFLAVSRDTVPAGPPRILRHPFVEPGRIQLELCRAPERERRMVIKSRDKEAFRLARKADWGDSFPV